MRPAAMMMRSKTLLGCFWPSVTSSSGGHADTKVAMLIPRWPNIEHLRICRRAVGQIMHTAAIDMIQNQARAERHLLSVGQQQQAQQAPVQLTQQYPLNQLPVQQASLAQRRQQHPPARATPGCSGCVQHTNSLEPVRMLMNAPKGISSA